MTVQGPDISRTVNCFGICCIQPKQRRPICNIFLYW